MEQDPHCGWVGARAQEGLGFKAFHKVLFGFQSWCSRTGYEMETSQKPGTRVKKDFETTTLEVAQCSAGREGARRRQAGREAHGTGSSSYGGKYAFSTGGSTSLSSVGWNTALRFEVGPLEPLSVALRSNSIS